MATDTENQPPTTSIEQQAAIIASQVTILPTSVSSTLSPQAAPMPSTPSKSPNRAAKQSTLPVVKLSKEEEAAKREAEKAAKAVEKAAKEAEKLRKEREREAEKAKKEAERAAKQQEKEEREREKEAKKAEAAAKKAAADEEKRKKAEEKAKKEEEKRQAQAKKDEEKQKKEEERLKKERAQKKLDFFGVKAKKIEPTAATAPNDAEKSDFEKTFLPFEVKSNTIMAPLPFEKDAAAKECSKRKIDEYLSGEVEMMDESSSVANRLLDALNVPPFKRRKHYYQGKPPVETVKELITKLGKEEATIDPKAIKELHMEYERKLSAIPRKFILQHTGMRPAYIGTFTKMPTTSGLQKGRNPFQRSIPTLNYDYESEEEWIVDEEGEDLVSGDEEEEDMDDDEEMDEFLDDEDDPLAQVARRKVVVELEPICSGLCWEDEHGVNPNSELNGMRIEKLIEIEGPIDPFKDYWSKKPASTPTKPSKPTSQSSLAPMPPPSKPAKPTAAKPATAKKLVPSEMMEAFKAAIVEHNQESKADLITNLSKAFPDLSKKIIGDTITTVAARVTVDGGKQWKLLAD